MSDYLDLPRAIAIQVPKPERICFIITPFRGEFQSLSRLIEDAANRLAIRPIRTDKIVQGPDILKQIHDNIQSAKIVVAVCSPVTNDEPNVNVMYELGFARALGKSILLVTTLHQPLPFDLGRFMRLVEYTPAQLADARQSEVLVIELKDRMHTLLDAMDTANNPLTDPSYTAIRVIPSRYAVPDFWINIQTVVSFAKTIHHEMQMLQHICLDTLQAKAAQVRDNVPKTIHVFTGE